MVTIDIPGAAEKRGIKNSYQLMKAINSAGGAQVDAATASRWWKSKSMTMISTTTIDTICHSLKCKPSDFIIYQANVKK
jgi:DNA-binding Xre family transcriptional regulator